MNIKNEKNALRSEYRKKRAELDAENKKQLDATICRRIVSLSCFRYADTVLLYYPIKGEIDITPVALEALRLGKIVAYPVCGDGGEMVFRRVGDLSELTCDTKYSIPEPDERSPVVEGGSGAVCIVPAFAFDKEGFRLGYGGGYYDRFLKRFDGVSIGAVYEDFLVDALPRGYYDISVDVIITERGRSIARAYKEKKEKSTNA